jgi:thiosulfate/3-mercaptopyruvate sulfurtransferase
VCAPGCYPLEAINSMHKTLIDCASLRPLLGSPLLRVVDCRFDLADPGAGERAFDEAHIPGAAYVHLDHDLSATRSAGSGRHPFPSVAQLNSLFSRIGIAPGIQVVAYDAAGGMLAAARLWWLLRYMGHDAVAVLDGGWQAWTAAGGPVESLRVDPSPSVFIGVPHPERLVGVDDVQACAALIDSRDPARYRGEAEPIDPVAGHIPGAVNHFCRNNLDAEGRFRPVTELREQFNRVSPAVAAGEATFYCGSGVTACHNILAAAHAGYPEPRLYAGSWSQWCSDPARPVARGP